LIGLGVLAGGNLRAPNPFVAQMPSPGWRIRSPRLRTSMQRSSAVLGRVLRFTQPSRGLSDPVRPPGCAPVARSLAPPIADAPLKMA
jgi:hypothetical protein